MTRRQYPAWLRRRRHGAADQNTMEDLAGALAVGDDLGIRALLHPDVVLVIDGGGHVATPQTPLHGSAAAADGLAELVTPETSVTMASINSVPGFVLVRDGVVVAAVTSEVRSGLLSSVWVVCNPVKLRHWNRR